MKEPSGMMGQTDLTSHKMWEVVMQTAEPDTTIEATERLVKILDSTYVKANLKQVADNATHMNDEERTQLIRILEDLEKYFDGNLGDWDTDLVDLELNPYSKPFNCKYYIVPRISKDTFCKELKRLVKIRVLNPVQPSQ